jgi:hypothetical protein
MAPLPNSRLPNPKRKVPAFDHTIIDAAGPFTVKRGRSDVKRYIILFSCMIYRCVHAEVSFSLDTDSFLMAFARFAGRRGLPSFVRTDNGGNFKRGAKELTRLWRALERDKITGKYPELKWEFAPPLSPHTNGAIERLVGAMKRGLEAIVTSDMDDEVFNTLVIKVEGLMNARPLTYLSDNPEDLRPLTPNHFLLPVLARELRDVPEGEVTSKTRKFKMIENIQDQFWNRFIQEYLPSLNKTERWTKHSEDIKVGDIVFLLEKNERGKYPLAKVVEVYPGADGRVRTVDIMVPTAKFIKPPKGQKGNLTAGQSVLADKAVYRRHICNLVKVEADQ